MKNFPWIYRNIWRILEIETFCFISHMVAEYKPTEENIK